MTVTIDRIAAGGDGVARLADGMAVFVPRTAPGDRVDIDVVERHKRFARGRVRSVVEGGQSRVEPLCRHYDEDDCGGCQLQHLDYETQLKVKRTMVGDALRRIGKFDIEDPPIVPADQQWEYRNKVALALRGNNVGFHPIGRADAVFALDRCAISDGALMDLWAEVRQHVTLLPRNLHRLVLRRDRGEGFHVTVVGGDANVWDATPFVLALARPDVAVWWKPKGGASRIIAGPETGFPALAFDQVNPKLAAQLRRRLVEVVGDVREVIAWDLYGGVGDTATLLANAGARVWSVDVDRSAVAWGKRELAHERVTRIADRVEDAVHRLPEPTLVVVNPPRTGLGASVAKWVERWGSQQAGRKLLYVSCDPATLARDLTQMPAFAISSVEAFDLFPQTSHVESLVLAQTR
jgi:23S rRNA (uracil1939-C5)-methyltransferase